MRATRSKMTIRRWYSGTVTDENGKPVEGVNVIVKKDGKYMCTKKSGSINGAELDTPKTIESADGMGDHRQGREVFLQTAEDHKQL